MDYVCERGASRNFQPWRETRADAEETDEQRLDRLEREEAEELEMAERNAMEELEQKMMDSKREMQVADALDEIRTRNARIERGEKGAGQEAALAGIKDLAEEERLRAEKEDEEAARRAFAAREQIQAEENEINTNGVGDGTSKPDGDDATSIPAPTFERTKKIKKPTVPNLVKKVDPPKTAAVGLGLGDYDSD